MVPGDAAVLAERAPVLLLGIFQLRELEGCCFADRGNEMQRGIDRSDAEPGAGGPEASVSSVLFLT